MQSLKLISGSYVGALLDSGFRAYGLWLNSRDSFRKGGAGPSGDGRPQPRTNASAGHDRAPDSGLVL